MLGPIAVEAMGITLMHEHIVLDTSVGGGDLVARPTSDLAERPLDISMLGDLRMNPFLNRDNCGLLDAKVAIEELKLFVEYGGRTVVDPDQSGNWARSIGPAAHQPANGTQHRDGRRLLPGAVAPWLRQRDVDRDVAAAIARDCGVADDNPEVCAGLIGEIGVSKDFTAAEEKVLRGAARASPS